MGVLSLNKIHAIFSELFIQQLRFKSTRMFLGVQVYLFYLLFIIMLNTNSS